MYESLFKIQQNLRDTIKVCSENMLAVSPSDVKTLQVILDRVDRKVAKVEANSEVK